MQTFKTGDRVVVLVDSWKVGLENKLATVAGITEHSSGKCTIEIKVDDWNLGHSGAALRGTYNDRWDVTADEIVLVAEDFLDVDPIIDIKALLPTDATERKAVPIASGFMDYFPAALAEVSKVSFKGNEQHNPGQPLHWARGKSTDHADTMLRHFLERGTIDTDGTRHSAKMVWRALALLQMELENDGYPKARGAR